MNSCKVAEFDETYVKLAYRFLRDGSSEEINRFGRALYISLFNTVQEKRRDVLHSLVNHVYSGCHSNAEAERALEGMICHTTRRSNQYRVQ